MTRTLATLATVLLLALAGCGGDDESSSSGSGGGSSSSSSSSGGGGGQQIALSAPADGSLKFDKAELDAKAGTVTINFDNESDSTPHAVQIQGEGVDEKSDSVTGAKTSLTADLKAGEYKMFCPVGTHASQGMEGTLTVK